MILVPVAVLFKALYESVITVIKLTTRSKRCVTLYSSGSHVEYPQPRVALDSHGYRLQKQPSLPRRQNRQVSLLTSLQLSLECLKNERIAYRPV